MSFTKPKVPKVLKPEVVDSKAIEEEQSKEQEAKLIERRNNDSFRRAHDIRYKSLKELKDWQKPLWYEFQIRDEIEALDKEIEQQDKIKQGLK